MKIFLLLIHIVTFPLYTQWTIKPTNVTNEISSLEFVNSTTGWAAGSSGIILKTTDGGESWQNFQYNSSYRMYSLKFVNESTGFVIGYYYQNFQFQFNKILKTVNSGSGWIETVSAIGYNNHYSFNSIDFINPTTGFLCTSSSNGFVSTGTVLITTSGGENWSIVNLPTHFAYKKAACSSNGNVFVWGRYEIDVPGMDTNCIFRSTDGGSSWSEIYRSLGTFWRNLSVTGNIVSFGGELPGNSGILTRSVNSGITWDTIASGNIPNITTIFFLNNEIGWVAGFFGNILMTDNAGLNWYNQSQAQTFMLNDILFLPTCIGYAAGSNGTILKTTNCGITSIGISNNLLSEQYSLSQNYPNPFNPVTKIKFAISGISVAQTFLSVYDIIGREVAVLVNQLLQPGSYEADWDASAYPSGVYFYMLESSDFKETKKMVLIK